MADFSSETMVVRRQWNGIFKVLKEEMSRIPYPMKLSFRNEGILRTFIDKQRLRESGASRPDLEEILKEVLQAERKSCPVVIQIHRKK